MSHLELANWRQVLQACKGNAVCIENNNRFYAQKNLQNTQEFENACINNFNASNCQNLILRFQTGTQGDYNLKYIPNLYADILRLGGANANTTINSIRWNNATGGYFIRDTGIVNINRYHGNEAQAFIGELANDRLYGGGRAGSVAGTAGYGVGVNSVSGTTKHGDKRKAQSRTDSHRSVGDANKVVLEGRRYLDSETGAHVYIKGDRVVILDNEGKIITQFKNTKQNTRNRVRSGKWIPQ